MFILVQLSCSHEFLSTIYVVKVRVRGRVASGARLNALPFWG